MKVPRVQRAGRADGVADRARTVPRDHSRARILDMEFDVSDIQYWPETHAQGALEVTLNALDTSDRADLDFGVQIAPDGRVWVCLNGAAFLRFKPKFNRLHGGTQ